MEILHHLATFVKMRIAGVWQQGDAFVEIACSCALFPTKASTTTYGAKQGANLC